MRNTTKVEALIENCRSEGKWQRVIELTDELKTGSPNNGTYCRASLRNCVECIIMYCRVSSSFLDW